MSAPALRCSTCAIDWPNTREFFSVCHQCGGNTDLISEGNPLDSAEAISRRNHLRFENGHKGWPGFAAWDRQRLEAQERELQEMAVVPTSAPAAPGRSDGSPAESKPCSGPSGSDPGPTENTD